MKRGYTKKGIWDAYKIITVSKQYKNKKYQILDPGVVFFVAALNALKCKTIFSCEGHPDGFYISFRSSYKMARKIHDSGYFSIEVDGKNWWSMRLHHLDDEVVYRKGKLVNIKRDIDIERIDCLRWAAESWSKTLVKNISIHKMVLALVKAFPDCEVVAK